MKNTWTVILIIVASWVADVTAIEDDSLSDFSNDLATDLGPLLSLFGEHMTRQYLSESTSFLDYFIFALGPIGIISTVISVTRVCGHSSMRAFIGRSQEGTGTIEAELCTSTSRDVCELFNQGSITRVLGRPKILELIYLPSSQDLFGEEKVERLHLLKSYLGRTGDESEWMKSGNGQFEISTSNPPNLSINVGIINRNPWVFYTIAAVGFILQAGVISLAGVGVFVLGWDLSDSGNPASHKYAPIAFMVGTLLMCTGLWGCAALIGEFTQEVTYRRDITSGRPSQLSRMIWLQPQQVIGDQSFDPFALIEKETEPLYSWTCSRKKSTKHGKTKNHILTFVTVLAVLIGYIMHFIGLRGMKAWVSLAQLGTTVIMSILRGFLRMQRMSSDNNELSEQPDLVKGYELDWLAIEILKSQNTTDDRSSGTGIKLSRTIPNPRSQSNTKSRPSVDRDQAPLSYKIDYRKLLLTRQRLAYLTGHFPNSIAMEENEYQHWEDTYVKVRAKAKCISAALCSFASKVIQKDWRKGGVFLRVPTLARASFISTENGCNEDMEIMLKPSYGVITEWTVDSAEIEAILGTALWTLISDERVISNDEDSGFQTSIAEEVTQYRIFAAGPTDCSFEAGLWLGSDITTTQVMLHLEKNQEYSLLDLWEETSQSDHNLPWKALPEKAGICSPNRSRKLSRFSGWGFAKKRPQNTEVNLKFHCVRVKKSLLDLCAQELFGTLLVSLQLESKSDPEHNLASAFDLDSNPDRPVIVYDGNRSRLESSSVTELVEVFVESGVGTHSDAILCIVPRMRNQLHIDDPEVLASLTLTAAETYNDSWGVSENLLTRLCSNTLPRTNHPFDKTCIHLFGQALCTAGEYYRRSIYLVSTNGDKYPLLSVLGQRGYFNMMYNMYDSDAQHYPEIKEILDTYLEVIKRDPTQMPIKSDFNHVTQALRECDKSLALDYLVGQPNLKSPKELKASTECLSLAAIHNWVGLLNVLLELGAPPDGRDENGRTALSHCAELNHVMCARFLVSHGVSLQLKDSSPGAGTLGKSVTGRGPLEWAVIGGHEDMVGFLLDTADMRDQYGPALFAALSMQPVNESVIEFFLRHSSTPEPWKTLWHVINTESEKLLYLIDKLFSIHLEFISGTDWLISSIWAARYGFNDIIEYWALGEGLDKGLDEFYNLRNSPVHEAVRRGRFSTVQLLPKQWILDFDFGDDFGYTPLALAVREQYHEIAQYLLMNGASAEPKVDHIRIKPLHIAVRNGDLHMIRMLFKYGTHFNRKLHRLTWSLATSPKSRLGVQELLEEKEKSVEDLWPLIDIAEVGKLEIDEWVCQRHG